MRKAQTAALVTETSLKGAVRDLLLALGIFNYPIRQGLGSYPGLPDRVMHRKGHVEYLEIKTLRGKLSSAQLAFQEQCRQDEIPYWVIRCVDDLIAIIGDDLAH